MKQFRRLIGYMMPYKGLAVTALLMMVLGVAFDLLSPWFLKQAIDEGIAKRSIPVIVLYTLLLAGGQILKSFAMYTQGYTQEKLGQDVVFDLRRQLYGHLQRLSFRYYDKAKTGQIMSRMTGDIEAVKNFTAFGANTMLAGLLTFVGTFAVMLALQWKVTLLSMIAVPLIVLALWQFNRRVGPAWGEIREQMGRLTTTLQENITGIRVVKAFAQERLEKRKFHGRNETNFDSNMKRANIEAKSFPLMNFYGGLVFLMMNWIGCIAVVQDDMSLGTLMAFQWYAWGIVWPLNMLGWIVNIMQQAMKAAPRVYEIIDMPADIVSPPTGGVSAAGIMGHVEFNQVTFRYEQSDSEDGHHVLNNLSLTVEPGQVIAILGATGSGKSSFVQLLVRFYDVTDGEVRIDGVNVKDYELDELRAKIGIVPQETFLFSATIRDNIAFGRPDAAQTDIEWAAKQANIHDFIQSMPQGYDTLIGERGVCLSGGQRQRVALARAILMDPPILVLDEATASVDTATESSIQEALQDVMRGRTTFIVAQRLSTIQRADHIIVLQGGMIAEQGSHRELMERDGFFNRLFRLQLSADEAAASSGHTARSPALTAQGKEAAI